MCSGLAIVVLWYVFCCKRFVSWSLRCCVVVVVVVSACFVVVAVLSLCDVYVVSVVIVAVLVACIVVFRLLGCGRYRGVRVMSCGCCPGALWYFLWGVSACVCRQAAVPK